MFVDDCYWFWSSRSDKYCTFNLLGCSSLQVRLFWVILKKRFDPLMWAKVPYILAPTFEACTLSNDPMNSFVLILKTPPEAVIEDIFLRVHDCIFRLTWLAVILINPPPSTSWYIKRAFYNPIGEITLGLLKGGSLIKLDMEFVTFIFAILSSMKQSVLEYIKAPPS
jgi:hypothetical protein